MATYAACIKLYFYATIKRKSPNEVLNIAFNAKNNAPNETMNFCSVTITNNAQVVNCTANDLIRNLKSTEK